VLFKRFDLSLTSIELTAWQLVFGGIPIALCALILDPLPDVSALSTRTILAVLYTAFIAQWFGQWAWFRSLQLLPANVAAIGSLSIPIVGLYASAVLLEESITWIELMALAMVLVALGLVLIGRDGLNALKRRHHK
jgi:drug/metabolite transporter (DMT)-like permease